MNQNPAFTPLSRRRLIQASGTVAASATLGGCGFFSTDPDSGGDGGDQPGSGDTQGFEAPQLARQVEAGDLPALAERLPAQPVVITPVERAGVYGGTWRTALLGPADAAWLDQLLLEPMVRWDPQFIDLEPNVAESYEANPEGTEITFTLRAGMRWSDGAPFTADDIVFAQNDVFNNADLTPLGDLRITAKKVDDLVVRLTLSEPASLYLATGLGNDLVTKPMHYLKEFHQDHNPDIEQLVEQEEMTDWVELFQRRGGGIEGTPYNAVWQNPELPRLHAWVPQTPLGEGGSTTFVRNPYYWKTDPDGRQLPYIDEIRFAIIQDEEVMLLRAQSGEFDMHFRHFNSSQNKPVLAGTRERGEYRFFDTQPAIMNNALIIFNLSHKDEVKREIFNNLDFRIGMSHALNRDEISRVAYQRQGEPWQAAPRRESEFFDEEFAKQYTEFDLAKANDYLDRAGYARDGEGRRRGPDNEPIAFSMEFSAGSQARPQDTLNLIRGYWSEVGIDARLQPQERSLLASRNESNDYDVFAWEGDGGLNVTLVPEWYFPDVAYLSFARGWANWYDSAVDEGEVEPPAAVQEQMRLYDQIQQTTDRAEQVALTQEILTIAKENFWVMGTILTPPNYGIAKNNFRNVPKIIDPVQQYFQIDACQSFLE